MVAVKKEELLASLERIDSAPILVVGDLILDRYIWGRVERISPEAPVPIVEVVKTDARLGGAGNVVRNLAAIGATPSVCGIIGDDEDGRVLISLFQELGADTEGVIVDPARPTIVKTRVIAATQQIVRIDQEKRAADCKVATGKMVEIMQRKIDDSRAVILSDYAKGAVQGTVLDALEGASVAGRLGLGSRPLFVDPKPPNFNNYRSMSVAKPNRKEAEIASGISVISIDDANAAADILMRKWNSEMMVITLGEGGMLVKQRGESEGIHLETAAREVFDVSGAGDTVTAVFCSALATGSSPIVAGVLANIAAGLVVSEVGTVAVDLERLRAQIARWGER